jgi:hypothetical protein
MVNETTFTGWRWGDLVFFFIDLSLIRYIIHRHVLLDWIGFDLGAFCVPIVYSQIRGKMDDGTSRNECYGIVLVYTGT